VSKQPIFSQITPRQAASPLGLPKNLLELWCKIFCWSDALLSPKQQCRSTDWRCIIAFLPMSNYIGRWQKYSRVNNTMVKINSGAFYCKSNVLTATTILFQSTSTVHQQIIMEREREREYESNLQGVEASQTQCRRVSAETWPSRPLLTVINSTELRNGGFFELHNIRCWIW